MTSLQNQPKCRLHLLQPILQSSSTLNYQTQVFYNSCESNKGNNPGQSCQDRNHSWESVVCCRLRYDAIGHSQRGRVHPICHLLHQQVRSAQSQRERILLLFCQEWQSFFKNEDGPSLHSYWQYSSLINHYSQLHSYHSLNHTSHIHPSSTHQSRLSILAQPNNPNLNETDNTPLHVSQGNHLSSASGLMSF